MLMLMLMTTANKQTRQFLLGRGPGGVAFLQVRDAAAVAQPHWNAKPQRLGSPINAA